MLPEILIFAGNTQSGPLFDNMKERRKDFKYAFRACRKAKEKYMADVLACFMQENSARKFWQKII